MLILLTVFHTLYTGIFYLSLADFENFPGPQWSFSRASRFSRTCMNPELVIVKSTVNFKPSPNKPLVLTCLTPPCYVPVAGNMDTISEAVWQGMNFTLTSNLTKKENYCIYFISYHYGFWMLVPPTFVYMFHAIE